MRVNKNGIKFLKTGISNKIGLKHQLLEMTNGKCFYCFRSIDLETITIDHIIPKSKGGSDSIRNLAPCCERCNVSKGDSEADEFIKNKMSISKMKRIIKYYRGY